MADISESAPRAGTAVAPRKTALASEVRGRKPRTLWSDAWRQYRKHKLALLGSGVLLIMILGVTFGPFIYRTNGQALDVVNAMQGPSRAHPMGLDDLGHDIFARVLSGGRKSILVGLLGLWERVKFAAMPVMVLGLFQSARLMRFMRASMLENIRLDYVRTARAKGLRERTVVLSHVVRNALIPVVTIIALELPGIFAGAVVTEQIFRVPGMGALLITSIQASDTPVVMALTFIFSILVVLFNLAADVVYGVLDPRIKYG